MTQTALHSLVTLVTKVVLVALVTSASVLPMGCERELRDIHYGTDNGSFCRMTIVEPRFASAILTEKGRTLPFDAIECLARYVVQEEANGTDTSNLEIFVSINEAGDLLPVSQANFVVSESIRTPMGGGVVAYDAEQTDAISWSELLAFYRRER